MQNLGGGGGSCIMVYVKMVNEIKALEINATLVENDFRMKEMNAKKRVTFQNKVN